MTILFPSPNSSPHQSKQTAYRPSLSSFVLPFSRSIIDAPPTHYPLYLSTVTFPPWINASNSHLFSVLLLREAVLLVRLSLFLTGFASSVEASCCFCCCFCGGFCCCDGGENPSSSASSSLVVVELGAPPSEADVDADPVTLSLSERVLMVPGWPSAAASGSVGVMLVVEAVAVVGGGRLGPLPRRAALSLARTRAASASRSEAASLAVIVAMLRGDCCGAGSKLE